MHDRLAETQNVQQQEFSPPPLFLLLLPQAAHAAIEAFVADYIGPEAHGWMVPGVAMPPELILALGVALGHQQGSKQILRLGRIGEEVCADHHRIVSTRVSVALSRFSTGS